MSERIEVLLVGESWVSAATHYKGFDQFGSVSFHLGAEPLVVALRDTRFVLTYMPGHEAAEHFPFDLEELRRYRVVVLSDIGANTLLLPEAVWQRGETMPNRLRVIRDFVAVGGGLVMAGGYLSFQGIDGRARFRHTAVEEALPVRCLPHDDRLEIPQGFVAEPTGAHPVLAGLDGPWPALLGANEVIAKEDAQVLMRLPQDEGGHPLLVLGGHGSGRAVAWTSDIGPHWVPERFVRWAGYARLWTNILGWVSGE